MYYNQITEKYHFTLREISQLSELNDTIVHLSFSIDNSKNIDFISFISSVKDFTELNFIFEKIEDNKLLLSENEINKIKHIIKNLTSYYVDYLNKKDICHLKISQSDYLKFIHLVYEILSNFHFTMNLGIYPKHIKSFLN